MSAPPPRRRSFPWARLILLLLIVGALAYVLVPRYLSIAADGLVEGDLVPVAPLFRARIDRNLVQCGQDVRQGQPLAVVTNFIIEGDYAQNYQRALEDLNTQRIAQSEGLEQAIIEQAAAAEKYQSAFYDARKLETVKDAYEQTYRQGAIGKVAYEEAVSNWKAAQAQADTLDQLRDEAQAHINRIQGENEQRVAGASNQVALLNGLQGQVRSQTLGAPVTGRVVGCTAEPLAIVEAGTPIYKIFSPQRAYILGYFNPDSATSIRIGEPVTVTVAGLPDPVSGKVTMIYPTIERLPDELTKYFWQHEQWSKYRPIKIVFSGMNSDLTQQLAFGAQVHVEIRKHSLPWMAQTSAEPAR